ncbi:hypothetical protein [Bradyrhizobium elkanii]|uniref:hypothetical protein n=1 Tax=Bradyrhizobium elkanii TaxID=29448 RepID=UPI000841C11B|nr:hypothetical protein [Bradyrhizobium elkanii]ODM71865.1 hypothetical protein A6452_06425 [Bradyrhizobium elkanii]ODM84758.1 hypothetical protein A6X20_12505 [Bradyrhizobium elkanii]
MTLSLLRCIVWTAGSIVLASGSSGYAAEQFKILDASQIRARIVGNGITDGPHWSMYLRPDGKLISAESGSSWTGSWKIQGSKLCLSLPSSTELECNEVWMSGANVRMRANKDQETFDAIITRHHGN